MNILSTAMRWLAAAGRRCPFFPRFSPRLRGCQSLRGTSRVETLIGVLVLLGLGGIAAAILIKQSRYDRTVINPGLAAVEMADSTSGVAAASGVQEAAPPAVEIEGSSEVETRPAAAQKASVREGSDALQILEQVKLPERVKAVGQTEAFDATTLSDKIDGRAEFYLDLGFEQLVTRRFQLVGEPPCSFEAFLYRMSSPLAAFAAWSGQRRPDAKIDKEHPLSYSTANAFYFTRGDYYVELVSSSAAFGDKRETREFAEMLSAKLVGNASEPDVLALLPEEGRIAGSERLILKDAFGFAKLDKVILADFVVDGTTVTLFISPRATEAEAQELARAYHAFLVDEMGAEDGSKQVEQQPGMYVARSLGEVEVLTVCKKVLVGVHAAKQLEIAKGLVSRICGN